MFFSVSQGIALYPPFWGYRKIMLLGGGGLGGGYRSSSLPSALLGALGGYRSYTVAIAIGWPTKSPGKGVEKAGCQQGPWTEMETIVMNPNELFFCGRILHRVFRCVFRRTFRRTFCHIFRQARPCKFSCQGIFIHVTTKRLCQMRWHNIDNTEKHAIMEEGADMPETHCLSHPLCLTTLMEHMCDTHCAPATKSSSKNHNPPKNLVILGFFAALFAPRTLSPEGEGCASFGHVETLKTP